MNQTDQTLLEQMRITEYEVNLRKSLFSFSDLDAQLLKSFQSIIEQNIHSIVTDFYKLQTAIPDIALLIGDADTLTRLRSAQYQYIIEIFSGFYDLQYVNNRLRIGLVHKRIGVEPKLYLSAINSLKELLHKTIDIHTADNEKKKSIIMALDKLLLFDVSLVFDTYIRSLVAEIETAKSKSDQYAADMEKKFKERTIQLEEMSRTDALTGLLNIRHFESSVTTMLRSAERRSEPVTAVYIDVDDFKQINDTHGHQHGDEILRGIGNALKLASRVEDICIRYGGDEFCVLLSNCDEIKAKEIFIDRINQQVKATLGELKLSIGVVQTGPKQYLDAAALIQAADKKMYIDKHEHKAVNK